MSRRVLFMVQEFTQGGSERQCALAALGLHRQGWQVHAAALRPGGMRAAELAAAGIPLPVFPLSSFASWDFWRAGWAFRSYLRQHAIDIVHSFDVPSNTFAVPWARSAGVPLVFASQRAHLDLSPPSLRPLETLSRRLAHNIVVNCQSVYRELLSRFPLPPHKLHLIYNGIDTSLFSPQGPRAALPFPPEAIVIGTLCALRPEKDLHTLLRAFAQIAPDFPRAHLLLVGEGAERPSLEAACLPHRTYFAGTQSDVAPWYRAIDLFVLPSLSEALSNSLLEALACGCSVIASDTGGNPEITSSLYPPGDANALAALLRRQLEALSLPRAPLPERFTLPYMLQSLASFYEAPR